MWGQKHINVENINLIMIKIYSAMKALIENEGKFLILEQEFNTKRCLDLPGGKVEFEESPYDTLKREVKEETYLDIEIIKPLGVWWFFRISDNAQVICTTFICKAKDIKKLDLTKNPANEKIVNSYWYSKEELLKLEKLPHESLKKIFEML